jgi:peptidoglycan-associated lipoprotein
MTRDGGNDGMATKSTLEAKIFFEFDRWELSAESRDILEKKVGILRANPNLKIVIEGNADDKGSDEYNLALGQRRAASAKQFFVLRDIDASRISVVSYGEQRPACAGPTDDCRAQNRRDEFRVAGGM